MKGRGYEKLVALYMRLNGYFIVENFIVHSKGPSPQRTDVDVLGVRLPHQAEVITNGGKPLKLPNDPKLVADGSAINDVVIAEVKSGRPHINERSWKKDKVVLEYILRFVGFTDIEAKLSEVAECLRTRYHAEYDNYRFRIVAFGQGEAPQEAEKDLKTIDLKHTLDFVKKRFRRYESHKRHHPQWDDTILAGYLLNLIDRRGKASLEKINLDDIKEWEQSIRFEINAQSP